MLSAAVRAGGEHFHGLWGVLSAAGPNMLCNQNAVVTLEHLKRAVSWLLPNYPVVKRYKECSHTRQVLLPPCPPPSPPPPHPRPRVLNGVCMCIGVQRAVRSQCC